MAERHYPDPMPSAETLPFWDAAKHGKFLLRRCVDCGKSHWYPRETCPFCAGQAEWVEGSGKGTIYSLSVMRRAEPVYVMAYVTLDEGPTMMTNIVGANPDSLRIGDAVTVRFQSTQGGFALPCFAPMQETT